MTFSIEIQSTIPNQTLLNRYTAIIIRHIRERCGGDIQFIEPADFILSLDIDPQFKNEGFSIEYSADNHTRIIGNDARGLLYGIGKFLHTSNFGLNTFTPSSWQGQSFPEKPVRGIYFATHFHNFYHAAPLEEIQHYIEDLAMWGYNVLIVWYDMHHFKGITDPAAVALIDRLHAILRAAKEIGLQIGLLVLANESYAKSPKHLRADQISHDFKHLHGGYGLELCPSKPEAVKLMQQWFQEEFEAFIDLQLDLLCIWPYDQGGCSCADCSPWGSNGFLQMAEKIATLARQFFPQIEIILSTWLFDRNPNEINGEWEGMAAKLTNSPSWVNYILADAHFDFPEYPLKNGIPGNLPLINFPEISMWEMNPWGGYGANPLPQRFQNAWNSIGAHLSGGLPYSEGIFEDINKVIWSQFYWDSAKTASETVLEYLQYEFPNCNASELLKAIFILEQNHQKFSIKRISREKLHDYGSEIAYRIFQKNDVNFAEFTKTSWRWRILFLRAFLDFERYCDQHYPNEPVKQAFEELNTIYHTQTGHRHVKPPFGKIHKLHSKIARIFRK